MRSTPRTAFVLAIAGLAVTLADAATPAAAPARAPAPAPASAPATAAATATNARPTTNAESTDATRAPAAELLDAAGLRQRLAAQRGKIVVLNLWATWCVPCLREIPDLVAVAQELAPRGVTLLGLSMDEPSALDGQVEPFRRKHFPQFHTALRATADMDSIVSVVDPAWNEILPTTYLIGRDGQVAKKIQGKRTLEQFRELIKEVP